MKNKSSLTVRGSRAPSAPRFTGVLAAALLALVAGARLAAGPLTAPAAVHVQPDAAAPVLEILPAGTEPFTAVGVTAPAGWLAVALPGTHEVFLRKADQLKDLSPRPGASYLLTDKAPETPVALAEKGDLAEITGQQGRFMKFKLTKPLIGYIPAPATAPISTPVAVAAPTPSVPAGPYGELIIDKPTAAPAPSSAPDLAAPSALVAITPSPASHPSEATPAALGELPRLFQGTLVSTYSPLRPRRPYAYQLNDRNGERYAYLDASRLPPGTSLDSYAGRTVVVYGVAQSVAGVPEMVIAAENIQAP